jgi:hypothetical protein
VQFAFLTPPTFLMGMSLPFLVRALVGDTEGAARTVGYLYGLNTFGAAVGALLTPWLLVRHHGMRTALFCAAAANLLAGLGALALLRGTSEPRREEEAPSSSALSTRPLGRWLALYATSGVVALALEILWFRLIDVAVKSSGFTFGTVLAVYLAGCGLGTLLGTRLLARSTRPLRAFLLCQTGILLYAGVAVLALVWIPPQAPYFSWFFDLWGGRRSYNLGGAWQWGPVLRLYLLLPAALYGPPTVLMGLSFVALQRAVHDDVRGSGRRVGLLQAANIAGCVTGSLLVGLWALTVLGSAGTLRALLVLGTALALVALLLGERRRLFVPLGAALALVAVLLPGEQALFPAPARHDGGRSGRRRGGRDRRHRHLVARERPAPRVGERAPPQRAAVRRHPHAARRGAGRDASRTRERGRDRPRLRRHRLGRGVPAAGDAGRHRVRDLRAAARPAAPRGGRAGPAREARRFLEDPRISIRFADGRNALLRSTESYDLIEMDALFPSSPYAGNLYSVEFYELCARRLRPGGLMCTWAPTPRVHASFTTAFPHVVELDAGRVLVGSNQPIAFDAAAWHARATSPQMVAYLGPARVQALVDFLRGARPAVRRPQGPRDLNRDLFPRDELNSP